MKMRTVQHRRSLEKLRPQHNDNISTCAFYTELHFSKCAACDQYMHACMHLRKITHNSIGEDNYM